MSKKEKNQSCSLINESKVLKAGTDGNDIIVEGDPHLADGTIVGLLGTGEWRLWIVLALARLFVRQENLGVVCGGACPLVALLPFGFVHGAKDREQPLKFGKPKVR